MDAKVGWYSSFESFGAVDGPGLRMVYFLQGCPLRCKYCHNPETQEVKHEKSITVDELLTKFDKTKEFYQNGGITLSGGEPLMQIDFCIELFKAAKAKGINTCADTSMITFVDNPIAIPKWEELIKYCDLFICDIKEMDTLRHKDLTGLGNENILKGIRWLDDHGAKTWIRHVLVPGWTDNEENLIPMGRFISHLKHMEKFEILPYHNMMIVKYQNMHRDFLLNDVVPPTRDYCRSMLKLIQDGINLEREGESIF